MESTELFLAAMLESLNKVAAKDDDKKAIRTVGTLGGAAAGGYLGHRSFSNINDTWHSKMRSNKKAVKKLSATSPMKGKMMGKAMGARMALSKPRLGDRLVRTGGGAMMGAVAGNVLSRLVS